MANPAVAHAGINGLDADDDHAWYIAANVMGAIMCGSHNRKSESTHNGYVKYVSSNDGPQHGEVQAFVEIRGNTRQNLPADKFVAISRFGVKELQGTASYLRQIIHKDDNDDICVDVVPVHNLLEQNCLAPSRNEEKGFFDVLPGKKLFNFH